MRPLHAWPPRRAHIPHNTSTRTRARALAHTATMSDLRPVEISQMRDECPLSTSESLMLPSGACSTPYCHCMGKL